VIGNVVIWLVILTFEIYSDTQIPETLFCSLGLVSIKQISCFHNLKEVNKQVTISKVVACIFLVAMFRLII